MHRTLAKLAVAATLAAPMALALPALAAHNADGLAGYWNFDDGADPTADTSGHGNAGDVNGAAVFSGSALTFDGVDDYVEVAHDSELDMTGAYSLSAWVDVTDVPAGTYRPIAFRGATNSNDIEVYVQWGSGDLIVAHNRGNLGTFDFVGFDNPPVGSLFHLVVTYDGTNVQAYYNDVAPAVVQQTTAVGAPLDTDKGWWLGKVDHSAFGGTHLFKGTLDEVRIYSSALSADEVAALGDYSEFSVSTADSAEAFNPVGTEHTFTVTVDPALAQIPVLFEVAGANATSTTATTTGDGSASFAYTGTVPGTDTITACVDSNSNGCADEVLAEKAVTQTKYWLAHYVTGGGNIKDDGAKKPHWTFGGVVGLDELGDTVGQFQLVDHVAGTACHFNSFSGFTSTVDTAQFDIDSNDCDILTSGAPYHVTVIDGSPDSITIDGEDILGELTGGNFTVHEGSLD